MTYTVIWNSDAMTALRRLRAQDREAAARVTEAVRQLASDPLPSNSGQLGGSPFRRLRIAGLRVLYEIDDEQLCVTVLAVGQLS